MAKKKTISGEVLTITETTGTDVNARHYFAVAGTLQGVIDYLNSNNIPAHKEIEMDNASGTWTVIFHK